MKKGLIMRLRVGFLVEGAAARVEEQAETSRPGCESCDKSNPVSTECGPLAQRVEEKAELANVSPGLGVWTF